MKKLNLGLAIIISMIFIACSQNTKKEITFPSTLTISGTTEIPTNSKEVKVFTLGDPRNRKELAKTEADSANGNFSVEVTIDAPNIYSVDLLGQKGELVILDGNDVTITYNKETETYTVGGTDENKKLAEAMALMKEQQQKSQELAAEYQSATSSEAKAEVEKKYNDFQESAQEDFKAQIRKSGTSLANIIMIEQVDINKNIEFADSVVSKLAQKYPKNEMVQRKMGQIEGILNTAVGQSAPEIKLPTPEGTEVALSSLKGNYVLIDFWASWCGPCRRENPNVVKVYNKYHDKGFEIFSVSLDRDKDSWVAAIEKDGLTWTHVSDLKFWQSVAAKKYGINSIPATLLLDKEGKIIAKNLRGEALEEKLAELFN